MKQIFFSRHVLTSMVLLLGAGPAFAQVAFEETFEDLKPGPIQNQHGWAFQQVQPSEEQLENVVVLKDPSVAFKGSQCLAITGGGGFTEIACPLKQLPFDEGENNLVSCYLKFEQAHKSGLTTALTANQGGQGVIHLCVLNSGAIAHNAAPPGGAPQWKKTDGQLDPGEWYHFEFQIHPENQTYDVLVTAMKDKSVVLKTNLPMARVDQPLKKYWTIHFGVDNAGGNRWLIDDFSISTAGK